MGDDEAALRTRLRTKSRGSDDEGERSTADQHSVDQHSRQTSEGSDGEGEEDGAVFEGCAEHRQTTVNHPALVEVLASLPHFKDACICVEEDDSEDEDAVRRISQLAQRFALSG